ncbi:carboxymuconolactone decarboxylase family protein [Aquabacterium sp. A7-Y]|uniref:carboxymuconolactone decarboxylase family protein n=1 Tax=Aquabacterium sp. A7-Y TaxID=1349605 RepID=UPI00223CD112|nr:carboxymuconolactone decarboxylase family protein [Aquabacterium sp. A7-Y]MCW7540595.1 carboxymuconolactone decarboxylase family protein [Aquabacterium sp. A7-Y]
MCATLPETERYERGLAMLEKVDGAAGLAVVERLQQTFPEFARHLVAFAFGDIYPREGLSLREREIAVVAALAALGTATPQLKVHLQAALHVGCTPRQLQETLMMMSLYAGFPAALNALALAAEVFREQGIALPLSAEGDEKNAGPEGPASLP